MGIIHMVTMESYTYIIFPISTFIWGLYKYFKDDDDEWCRRNNVDNEMDMGWLMGNDDYYYPNNNPKIYNVRNRSIQIHSSSTPRSYVYNDPVYKKIIGKIKKNSIISTDKFKTKQENI